MKTSPTEKPVKEEYSERKIFQFSDEGDFSLSSTQLTTRRRRNVSNSSAHVLVNVPFTSSLS